MTHSIMHRGPDDHGFRSLRQNTLHFGHVRLSILDLSPSGHQPMSSQDGRFTIIFNGEIYNYKQVRQLFTLSWKSDSDTEVLVEALAAWGVEETLKKIEGMFAFVAYDHMKDKLYLARDRAGEKPLYYGSMNETFFFGSELKSFAAHPKFVKKISKEAFSAYSRLNYVPAPLTIFESVFKLRTAHYLEVDPGTRSIVETCYWDVTSFYQEKEHSQDLEARIKMLEDKLSSSVQGCMLADVPLGAFLSGGVDSSLIVSHMQRLALKPVKTFTIGFKDPRYDESVYAKAVADHLKTEHHEFFVSNQELLGTVSLLPRIFDEPFADPSQIPTYLVSQKARDHVKVCLTGDGGDELYGGYYRYIFGEKIQRLNQAIPKAVRTSSVALAKKLPIERVLPFSPEKLQKLFRSFSTGTESELYSSVMNNDLQMSSIPNYSYTLPDSGSFSKKMMLQDFTSYLPDDILVKTDRASMAVSLETRAPFLGRQLLESAWSIPMELKLKGKDGKWILREILKRHIPQHLVDRPKMGFSVPMDRWLRKDLKSWAEEQISPVKLRQHGLFEEKAVRLLWDEHQAGKVARTSELWNILTFQQWYGEHMKGSP